MAARFIIFLFFAFSLPLLLLSSTQTDDSHKNSEIQELAHLDSTFDKSVQEFNAKPDQKIQLDIHRLHDNNTTIANEKLRALEEQIQFLWDALRKKNFEIYTLDIRARDAEKRLELLREVVEEKTNIVSEQWIQIQQVEQALQFAQLKASKVKWERAASECPVVKYIKNSLERLETLKGILDPFVYDVGSVLNSYISEASYHIRRTYTTAKYYHHQLQGYIKQTMMRNELTAVLANDELVFFVVSALITFPVLSLCTLISSRFS